MTNLTIVYDKHGHPEIVLHSRMHWARHIALYSSVVNGRPPGVSRVELWRGSNGCNKGRDLVADENAAPLGEILESADSAWEKMEAVRNASIEKQVKQVETMKAKKAAGEKATIKKAEKAAEEEAEMDAFRKEEREETLAAEKARNEKAHAEAREAEKARFKAHQKKRNADKAVAEKESRELMGAEQPEQPEQPELPKEKPGKKPGGKGN